jgi:hypothetical protein
MSCKGSVSQCGRDDQCAHKVATSEEKTHEEHAVINVIYRSRCPWVNTKVSSKFISILPDSREKNIVDVYEAAWDDKGVLQFLRVSVLISVLE